MAQPCTIDCLPDGLLGHIMALLGRKHGRNLLLVSHRWHRLFFAEPRLWRDFEVSIVTSQPAAETLALQVERQAALLRHVAPLVQRFSWTVLVLGHRPGPLSSAGEAGLGCCLAALQPGRLAQLELWSSVNSLESTGAALQRLAGVTCLVLESRNPDLVAASVASLGSHLRDLQLELEDLPPAVLTSIAQLVQLTALGLAAENWPPLGVLSRLSQLKQLVLLDSGGAAQHRMQPPLPSGLPAALERFSFESLSRTFQLAGCDLRQCLLWQGTTSSLGSEGGPRRQLPLLTAELQCARPVPSLAQLLSTMQLAGVAGCAVQRLQIAGCLPVPAGVAGCTQLSSLRELVLDHSYATAGPGLMEPAVAALLQQATGLTLFELLNFGRQAAAGVLALPACLANYRGLTMLSLVGQGLTDLPAGDYLADLPNLDLTHNEFTRLPATLSTATALTSLSMAQNCELRLCEADAAVLAALPRLQRLNVQGIKAADPALLQQLQHRMRMPGLTAIPPPAT